MFYAEFAFPFLFLAHNAASTLGVVELLPELVIQPPLVAPRQGVPHHGRIVRGSHHSGLELLPVRLGVG